jgi:hypothetical protein
MVETKPKAEKKAKEPIIVTEEKATKLAIVGFAPNWDKAPFANEDFEIWGLNELYKYFETHNNAVADRWFEIHSRFSPSKNTEEHIGWLKKCPIPVYMQEHYPDIPESIPYPLEEVMRFVESKGITLDISTENGEYVTKQNRYVTNSISWMFLLGWMEGFKEIHIYGVDLACKEEYLYQRPNLEGYIMAAQVDGVKVVTPETCDLLKASQLYGFETDNKMRIKMKSRKVELQGRINQQQKELNKIAAEYKRLKNAEEQFRLQTAALEGCIKEIDYWMKNWVV